MVKIAALTMVYNEPDFLPVWLRHYTKHVGEQNCFVIDHGSDDGSTSLTSGIQIIRMARSPHDDVMRVKKISEFVHLLLQDYDVVIHTDVDEIVFPDPRLHSSLVSFCEENSAPIITAYGFELFQMHKLEAKLDTTRPILLQRQWARFTSPMCKPILVRRVPTWAPGFHSTKDPVVFGDLFLFHLRWVDYDIGLKRLRRTRSQPWVDPKAGSWQRLEDSEFDKLFASLTTVPMHEGCSFFSFDPLLKNAADRVLASQAGRENDSYRISLDIWANEAWRVPKAMKSAF